MWTEIFESIESNSINLRKEELEQIAQNNYFHAINIFKNLTSKYHRELVMKHVVNFAKYIGKDRETVIGNLGIGRLDIISMRKQLSPLT